ncbi:MAG: DUF938 domain-containing protein [Bacteriovoracaceae bacterium]|jgi:cyclopropane fatty-acyl-phospholipid synthase-like methyltransferase|nr:DUF938 domain-containing protein [Bacteriovoracaceae bacterium]
MRLDIPFSTACERNKQVILAKICDLLSNRKSIIEIGSGTGQHAIFFAKNLPNLNWYTSDIKENLETITLRIKECPSPNLHLPFELEIGVHALPKNTFDGIFTANTFHILPMDRIRQLMGEVSKSLPKGGVFLVYGPFHLKGKLSSESSTVFDHNLRRVDPLMGIRELEEMIEIGDHFSLVMTERIQMPTNNQLLVFFKNIA